MRKKEKGFICTNCGYKDKYFHVVCPNCGAEDSMIEIEKYLEKKGSESSPSVFLLSDIKEEKIYRYPTLWRELDYVLGGGIVSGSVILLAGPPGVGKSTLALMLTDAFQSPIYISGEESLSQVGARARRIGVKDRVAFAFATSFDEIQAIVNSRNIDLLVIDSLQVMRAQKNVSFVSHNEARIFMSELVSLVKKKGITTLVLGHVTKEGAVAGPKTVEHLVDVVLYLNTTSRSSIRSLHVGKNRFGPSDGVMFMQMTEQGIIPLSEKVVLSESGEVGQAYTVVMQGNTPSIIDIQVLITPSYTNVPRRVIGGYPNDKFYLLLAVLEKKLGLKLYNKDVFVKVSGDYFWKDSGIDIAIVAGILSAYYNVALPGNVVWIGEVDLLGRVRFPENTDVRKNVISSAGGSVADVSSIHDVKTLIQRWR